jgi:large subunit ribosomal protein L15
VTDELNLSSLKPAQARKERKRVGRGLGSGKGRYSGRGIKGQKSRAGSAKMRPGFEGGQMPLSMRVGKQRGATSKDAMPIGPFRTHTVAVNVSDLERVFADGDTLNIESLLEKGLIKNTRSDVKVLGNGDLRKKFSVTAHAFSASAREKITAVGGTATALREPADPRRKKTAKDKKRPAEAVDQVERAGAETADQAEPAPEGET